MPQCSRQSRFMTGFVVFGCLCIKGLRADLTFFLAFGRGINPKNAANNPWDVFLSLPRSLKVIASSPPPKAASLKICATLKI
jgi:hypothetical protein